MSTPDDMERARSLQHAIYGPEPEVDPDDLGASALIIGAFLSLLSLPFLIVAEWLLRFRDWLCWLTRRP